MTAILQLPEIPRLIHFQSSHLPTQPDGGVGNLGGRLPPWKALGVWLNPDSARHAPARANGTAC